MSENLRSRCSQTQSRRSINHLRVAASALVVRVADVVDADPEREQGVVARPRCARRLACDRSKELVHLVREGQNRRLVRLHKLRVDRRATIGKVVGQRQRRIILYGHDVDPVHTTNGSEALCQVSLTERAFGGEHERHTG